MFAEIDDVVQFGIVLRVVVKDATDIERAATGRQVVVRGRRGVVHPPGIHHRIAVVTAIGVGARIEATEGTQRQILADTFFVFVVLAAVFGLCRAGIEAARQGHAVDAHFVGAAVFTRQRLAVHGQVVVAVAVQFVRPAVFCAAFVCPNPFAGRGFGGDDFVLFGLAARGRVGCGVVVVTATAGGDQAEG